jgi:hypothetical protein
LWAKLENSRDAIQTALQSVGRIEVKGHPAMDWIGTGWLVAPDVVITNRHVAKEFSRQSGRSWVFEPGMKGRIDFHEEFGGGPALEFSLTEVIGVHDDHDMALFRATKRSGGKSLPPPLKLARRARSRARGGRSTWSGTPRRTRGGTTRTRCAASSTTSTTSSASSRAS